MILNNAPVNEAVLSNVGEIGEFRIRNSAKAFNILSSGLYANKVRAIVRELSCNAVDSHAAAGKHETPFDVHLPNQLEPWFAIRDYGTGLSHEQVTQIYTTYFESTKTNSNEFIGALGLGSKSPFSYTDNFTVTAIQNGVKGIYSAFINDAGVPSIAKMMTETTDEPTGVEVKFSVNDRWDFSKFHDEARHVYKYFKLRPVVCGVSDFQFRDVSYKERDIIPGVHSHNDGGRSVAIMGNIAYPIEVPQANHKDLGDVSRLLGCGLEIHFAIGEVDFQASREGLSYIPQTIAAIKAKLEALNTQLAVHIAEKAKTFTNKWERAIWLNKQRDDTLMSTAAIKFITDTKDVFFDQTPNHYNTGRLIPFKILESTLSKKYNIVIRGFTKARGSNTCSTMKSDHEYDQTTKASIHSWRISVSDSAYFIKNDTKVGAAERAKFHWRNTDSKDMPYSSHVFVMEPVDKTKPAQFDAFLKFIKSPPKVMLASALLQKERAQSSASGKNVSILRLEERGRGGYYRAKEVVWRDAGKADGFDTNSTHYYLPLSGYNVISKAGNNFSGKEFIEDLKRCGFKTLRVDVLGVRKGDLDFIKTQKNWVNVEELVISTLSKMTDAQKLNLAYSSVDRGLLIQYNKQIVELINNTNSPYVKTVSKLATAEKVDLTDYSLHRMCTRYSINFEIEVLKKSLVSESTAIYSRYPLLSSLGGCNNSHAIAEYISMIDQKKGV